mmetsp:Transcript_94285/g.286340  ORF Transcript_94285/g.286340 Transcript_94285/m.286340 type:complete len:110 (+) Transcript_94285:158-487(+)
MRSAGGTLPRLLMTQPVLLRMLKVKKEDVKEAYEWLEFKHVVKACFIVPKMVSNPAALSARLSAIRVCRHILLLACRALLLSGMPWCGVSHPLEGDRGLLCLLAKYITS